MNISGSLCVPIASVQNLLILSALIIQSFYKLMIFNRLFLVDVGAEMAISKHFEM